MMTPAVAAGAVVIPTGLVGGHEPIASSLADGFTPSFVLVVGVT